MSTPTVSAPAKPKQRGLHFSRVADDWRVQLDRDDLDALWAAAFGVMERVEAEARHLDLCAMWEPLLDLLGELQREIDR